MKIYISGPYSKGDKMCNVRKAILVGEAITMLGHTPFIPHLNHFWDAICEHDEKFWIEYDLKWLPCCDAVLRMAGDSKGADIEVAAARWLNLPVYHKLEEIESLCPHCGESKLYKEYDDRLGKDVIACMCGWRGYDRQA